VTANTSANTTAVYLTIGREVPHSNQERTSDDDPFHLEDDPAQSRHRFRHVGWATALFQGRVNGFEQEPTAAATEVAPTFPGLHSGVYQQNLLIQVIEDPI
jgi:hypothetical protein